MSIIIQTSMFRAHAKGQMTIVLKHVLLAVKKYDEPVTRIAQLNGKCYMEVDADRAGMSEDARGMVDRVDHAVSELFGITPREEQWKSVVNCTPEAPAGATPGLLNGLHVDTANDEPLRYATSLLYLRSVHLGGETLFSTQAEAGAVLLEAGSRWGLDGRRVQEQRACATRR